jgi:hypothetical protein
MARAKDILATVKPATLQWHPAETLAAAVA